MKKTKVQILLFLLLFIFVITQANKIEAKMLTPKIKQIQTQMNSNNFKGQSYFDENGKKVSFWSGLNEKCKKEKVLSNDCRNFKWVIFQTHKNSVKENVAGYYNVYSGNVYSTIKEAQKDKKMQFMILQTKKRKNIEKQLQNTIKQQEKNKADAKISTVIIIVLSGLILISAVFYVITHHKHYHEKRIANKINVETFYPKK